jgi:hypothetical protein
VVGKGRRLEAENSQTTDFKMMPFEGLQMIAKFYGLPLMTSASSPRSRIVGPWDAGITDRSALGW